MDDQDGSSVDIMPWPWLVLVGGLLKLLHDPAATSHAVGHTMPLIGVALGNLTDSSPVSSLLYPSE